MSRSVRWMVLPVFAAGAWLAAGSWLAAQDKKPAGGTVDDLAWMAGRWQSSEDSTVESWEKPSGGVMIGMAQLNAGLYEFMLIAREGDDLVMRIRHFGPKLKNRDKDAMDFKVTKIEKNKAVFERPEDPNFQKITYHLNGEIMQIKLEGKSGDRPRAMTFQLKRTPL